MSKFELPINYSYQLQGEIGKHDFTFNIRGDSFKEIVKNANELKKELFTLYLDKKSVTGEKVTFQSGEDLPSALE